MKRKYLLLVLGSLLLSNVFAQNKNNAYTSYVDMGRPAQLTLQQVKKLKEQNGSPIAIQQIEIKSGTVFSRELDIRQNDVVLTSLIKHL